MSARRGARRVGHARLRRDHERRLGVPPGRDPGEAGRHLVEPAAQVERPGQPGRGARPRDRPGQRVVHLADARAVAEPGQRVPVPGRERRAGERGERPRRHVQQDGPGWRQVGQRAHPAAGRDLAARGPHRPRHRVGDRRAPAPGQRPAAVMGEGEQEQPDPGGGRGGQRQHRVGGGSRQQRPRPLGSEPAGDRGRRPRAGEEERGQRGRWPRRAAQAGQDRRGQVRAPGGQRADEAPVGGRVRAEAGRGPGDGAGDHRGPAAVERVRERHLGVAEGHAAPGQPEPAEERRGQRERVRGRAGVVPEPGQGQLLGAASAAGDRRALDDQDPQPGGAERDRRGEAVRPAAHDDRVRVGSDAHHLPLAVPRPGRRSRALA